MTQRAFFGASAIAVLLSSTSVQAQMTAEAVWENWQSLATSAGQTLETESVEREGDTLVVTGMEITQEEDGITVYGSLDEVRFRDMGDGKVEVTMSPVYPLSITTDDGESGVVEVNLEISQPGLRMIAGGTPDSTSYDFSADSVGISTTSVIEDGAAIPVKFNMTMTALGGNYVVTQKAADAVDLTTGVNAESISVVLSAADAETGSDIQLNAAVSQFAVTSGGSFGEMMAMENLADALNAGLAANMGLSYGAISYDMQVVENGENTSIKGKADSGTLGVTMDKLALAYKGGAKGVEVLLSGAQIPFPEVALRYAETAFDLVMPLSKADAPQDFRMGVTLRDLTVSDEIWAMVDPMANLPRDPATLVIDARGKATLTADIMDEAAMNSGMPPGQLDAFDLPALQLRIAGAELTGNGALTFDNTDLVSFDGMPAPTGTVNLNLSGGNGLLDKLVAMGMIPEDQAMGARMMMGMFARPGNGPDTLTSTLEFKDGGFFANGMRLK
jgi:hypothetical protein